ncbi:MAG: hypothetical protein K0S44_1322 [Bacteroidetes bacterium]|jgi:hypothetical protein|nr:hypothetical protein [Bacteroidota bacterium]
MQTLIPFKLNINKQFEDNDLQKGVTIVILHATRIPPHIGIISGKKYHSLSIKGQEINQSTETFIKNIKIRKIPSLFLRVKDHPVLSNGYLTEHFILNVQEFPKVESGKATCLSPVKRFFEDNYHIPSDSVHFIFELLSKLEEKDLIEHVSSLFIGGNCLDLPIYTDNDIQLEIIKAQKEAKIVKEQTSKN